MLFLCGTEKSVMNRDKPDGSTIVFPALAVFRGIYQRVASKLGVDPSFVSRVARGERKSPAVLSALQEEMNVIREHLNDGNGFLPKDGQFKNGELSNGSENGSLN